MEFEKKSCAAKFYGALSPVVHYLLFKLPPGPQCIPCCYVVNTLKLCIMPLCFCLMFYYDNWSSSAYLITALHGSYGLLWNLKHLVIPDVFWLTKCTVLSAISDAVILCLYFSGFFIVISQRVVVSPLLAFVAIQMYVYGIVLMMAADTQKYFVLQCRKGLISNGWFATCRNMNYFGEVLLYSSFAVVSQSWIPWVCYAPIRGLIFGDRWVQKDSSIRKKEGGLEYMQQTWMIAPFSPSQMCRALCSSAAAHELDEPLLHKQGTDTSVAQ
jgi:protein-S-isoprenylcysteine O-methyltransferase Ste14